MSSCIAVPPPSQHQRNNPATSWSQHRRGSHKKHKSLDKCVSLKPAATGGRREQAEIKVRWLDHFFWAESLKRK